MTKTKKNQSMSDNSGTEQTMHDTQEPKHAQATQAQPTEGLMSNDADPLEPTVANDAEAPTEVPQGNEEQQLLEQLKEQVAQQAEEVAAMKDAYVRAKAEQDNVRRRAEKEVANSRKFAVESFAKELLSVRDSLALAAALEMASDADDVVKSMKDGVDITLKQLDAAFAKFSVLEIEASKGAVLDPNIHQAMSIVAADGVASGCIVDVIQAGFTMHERLLRPAMVVVAK